MDSPGWNRQLQGLSLVKKTIRLGVLGCGQLVREVHLPILSRMKAVQVCALGDSNPAALTACASLAPKALHFSSLESLLAHPHLDAVLVATPSADHARHAVAILEAGKALYLEKPMASSLGEARRILDAAKLHTQPAMMGFNYRFHPLVQLAKDQLRGRKIDEVRSVFSIASRPLPGWKQHRATGGGALLDFGAHHLDLLSYILDQPIAAVQATIASQRSEHDTATLEIYFADGIRASGFYSLCATVQDSIEIQSADRSIRIEHYRPLDFPFSPLARFIRYQFDRIRSPWREVSFQLSLAAWCNSIQIGTIPPVTLHDGFNTMRAIHAAETSAQSGNIVQLNP